MLYKVGDTVTTDYFCRSRHAKVGGADIHEYVLRILSDTGNPYSWHSGVHHLLPHILPIRERISKDLLSGVHNGA